MAAQLHAILNNARNVLDAADASSNTALIIARDSVVSMGQSNSCRLVGLVKANARRRDFYYLIVAAVRVNET